MKAIQHYRNLLKDRINLEQVPFTERGSRLLLYRMDEQHLRIQLSESTFARKKLTPIQALAFASADGTASDVKTTGYVDHIICETQSGLFRIVFVDPETLLIVLPAGEFGLHLDLPCDDVATDGRGGIVHIDEENPCWVVYTTNAKILAQTVQRTSGESERICLNLQSEAGNALLLHITRSADFNRTLPDPDSALDTAARRWEAWFSAAPAVLEAYQPQYYYAWWVMACNLIRPYYDARREAMAPSKIGYVGIWNWDAYFHALAFRHIDSELARDQLRIILDHQQPKGMLPDVVHDDGLVTHIMEVVEADVTKPPLTAWAAWKLYEMDGDLDFLKEAYAPIVRSQVWWTTYCKSKTRGLYVYHHPYSSGLDDNPLWDKGLPVESPDLNAYLCLQYDYLADMAAALGLDDDVPKWQRLAGELIQRLIDVRWDAAAGLFWAMHAGERVRVRTPFNLFPIITGRLPRGIADRIVANLTDPEQFWTTHPVPTVARIDPTFNPMIMWRGPVWININYLLIDGLFRAGYARTARALRQHTINLVLQSADIFEYYHPETGDKPPRATTMFGWSAALFIDLVIQVSNEHR